MKLLAPSRRRPAQGGAQVPQTLRRVDDVSTFAHYGGVMRRFWLSLLMVIALASGGVANAMVMADCPMLAQAQMGAGHDCCPDGAPAAPDEQPAKQMGDCAMAQACRAGPAVTPSVEPVSFIDSAIVVREPVMSDKSLISRAPDEFWRPPRTI
ncbi:MAG: hypothetical protein KJZ75_15580 [Hyphomonadaceae bacterium]|nr:hypothetical protein [Hyphomonadaceae bacterium]